MLTRFLNDNTAGMKLARTIVQGLIGVMIAYAAQLADFINISADLKPVIVAAVMAILAPIMAMMRDTETLEIDEMLNDLGEPENPTIND